jgi:rod shape-determining protein MreD
MLRRAALSSGLLLIAILIQLTILNNLRLPGGAGPDLVLVVVVAVALTGGPMEGMLGGFCAGLALDVAPPATHLIGQYALVFCLVGYGCGLLGVSLDQSAWAPIGVVAVGAAAGELLYALTGMIFGDLDITWTAIRHTLPASVAYDVLLSPFVLYAVARARGIAMQGLAAQHGRADGAGLLTPRLAAAAGLVGRSGAVVRDSGTGRPPRLSARSLRAGATQGGSASGGRAPGRPPGRPVHLHFGGAGALQGGSASSPRIPRQLPARPVSLRLGNRNWASRYSSGLPSRPVSLRLGNRNWVSRYRGGPLAGAASGLLGDGAGGPPLRPGRGPRWRGGSMPGGSASGTRISLSRPVRPVHLRLGSSARRRDGAIGGSVLGRRRGGRVPSRRQFSGRALGNKSALNGRSAAGKTHVPRFRGVKSGALAGRRGSLATPGRGTFGRRRPIWRIFGKRTGGLR